MANDAVAWYTHISEATEALKREVFTMNRNELTPLDFGYKIMGHPDALIPTAKAKMKNAKLNVDYLEVDVAGKLIECPRLFNDKEKLSRNVDLTDAFLKKISDYACVDDSKGDLSFRGVSAEDIADYISRFKTKLWNFYFESSSLSSAISENGGKWNVFVKNGTKTPEYNITLPDGRVFHTKAQLRTSIWDSDEIKISGTKVRVGTGGCTSIGLMPGFDMKMVETAWRKLN